MALLPSLARTLPWLLLVFSLVLALEFLQTAQFRTLNGLEELNSLAFPARVEFVSAIQNPHASGPARVFDVPSFLLTCYDRHPSPAQVLFSGDTFRIRARIVPTPRGLLCVVEEMSSHVGA